PVAQEGIDPEFLTGLDLRWDEQVGGRGPTGRAIRERVVQVMHDTRTDPLAAPHLAAMLARKTRSIIALPLVLEDRCIGVLDIHSAYPDAFDTTEIALLSELAGD